MAIFAAADLVDAHHVGAEIAEQRTAPGPGDIAAKIENLDAVQYACHAVFPSLAWEFKLAPNRKPPIVSHRPAGRQADYRSGLKRDAFTAFRENRFYSYHPLTFLSIGAGAWDAVVLAVGNIPAIRACKVNARAAA
jgi:hypothetical protein